MATLVLTDAQEVPLSLVGKDLAGNIASGLPADAGVPQWSVTDDTVLALTVAPDSLSAVVAATAVLGNASVNVVAGALSGSLPVQTVADVAATIAIVAGTPVAIPAPAAPADPSAPAAS